MKSIIRSNPSAIQAMNVAKNIFEARYDNALFAFAAGSILRGEGTFLSDIDLVVVFEHLEAARRESFLAEGILVEAFVHDPETLAWFVRTDIERGRPSILNMIAEGSLIGKPNDLALRMKADMTRQLADGPPTLTPEQINTLRYEITDMVNDLRGDRSTSEIIAIGAMLYSRLVELSLRVRGQWNGTGKWATRLLVAVDLDLAARFDNAFHDLFVSASCEGVIALAESEMESVGGELFDGHCHVAPAFWRIKQPPADLRS